MGMLWRGRDPSPMAPREALANLLRRAMHGFGEIPVERPQLRPVEPDE
jgi:hypothetical protein